MKNELCHSERSPLQDKLRVVEESLHLPSCLTETASYRVLAQLNETPRLGKAPRRVVHEVLPQETAPASDYVNGVTSKFTSQNLADRVFTSW